ncbi:MAG: ABC transporter permease [Acidobacteriia bacterium]|nr:ABC transporter permease [Terriglobia bacterium]
MPFWRRIYMLGRNIVREQRVEQDLADEIHSYRQMLEDEKTRSGLDPRLARREALLELGGVAQVQEQVRDVRAGSMLQNIRAEIRQSLRSLARNPGLTATAMAMLALGMGATTVVFSVFYAALVQPLPFREPGRLVQLWETRLDRGWSRASFTEANFWDLRAHARAFEETAVYHFDEANLTGNGSPEKVTNISVSAGFFRTLGVSPILGRDFSYEEDRPGHDNQVAIVGNRFWKNRLSADPQILGKVLRLNDRPYVVVGVLPPGEPWVDDQTYIPLVYRPDADRGSFEFDVIGRLARSVSADAARADLQRVADGLARSYPRNDAGMGFHLEPSSTWVASDSTRRALWVLLGAVAFLLLIACLNIANLLLARGLSRRREVAIRTALGAGRGRLVRFVLMESILLSIFGGALGLLLAGGTLDLIKSFEIGGVPRLADASLNPWVLAFTGLIGVATGVLSGLAPALQAPSSGIASALRDCDRSQAGSRGHGRLRAALVTSEVALSFLLLVGAGLLIRSFTRLLSVDRGFQTENRLLFSVSMPGSYWEKEGGLHFTDRFLERLAQVPQVVSAGAVSQRPVAGGDPGMGIVSSSKQNLSGRDIPWAGWRIVTPGYFRAMGLPVFKGRPFTERDQNPTFAPRCVIISQRLANLLFPNEDPAGKHVLLWRGQGNLDAEVIGVVGDMRERGLDSNPTLAVYLPWGPQSLPTEFVLQTAGNPLNVVSAVRSIAAGLDPTLPISDVRSFEEVVSRSVSSQRFNTILLGIFSGLALLLATTGIYGVLSYTMSRRTSEIGLRVALGASARSILGMAIGQGMRPAFLGVAIGAVGAFWLSGYLTTMLYGVKPFDVATYSVVAVLLLATALLSCWLPARRAMRTDPLRALRME